MVLVVFSPKTLEDFEIYAAERSRVRYDLQALLWLYARSSMLAIRRLVIQALAGLPEEYNTDAQDIFKPHWVEIRDEKDRMLMDCMERVLNKDGSSAVWIPKDIPDIDCRIAPLLRLEIKFPSTCQQFPFGVFGGHNLDFSKKEVSNALSITLSSLEAKGIQKHT